MDENALRFQEFERQGWQEVADSYAGLTDGVTSGVADPLLDAAKVGRDTRVVDLATGPRLGRPGGSRAAAPRWWESTSPKP